MIDDFKPIIIISAWSSGSTALAGFLHHCGAYTCPPHVTTNDPKTPSAYEPLLYDNALKKLFDDRTFKKIGDIQEFFNFFDLFWKTEVKNKNDNGFQTIALKHPLQTLILPYLYKRLNPKILFITRPFEEIEKTRQRRGWYDNFGEVGARKIYSIALNFCIVNSVPYLSIPYNLLMKDKNFRQIILDYCELIPSDENLIKAEKFISR